MFFADPVAAFANVHKALRPDGLLSFVSWQGVFDNEWMLTPGAAVASVTGSPPPMPEPGEPGPFSLADPERIRTVLSGGDFHHIEVTPHNDMIVMSREQIPDVARTSIRIGASSPQRNSCRTLPGSASRKSSHWRACSEARASSEVRARRGWKGRA